MAGVMLSNAQVVRRWCSIVGALEGCLRSVGVEHTPAFVMGASGHAFRINIEPTHVCRTGPTVIDFQGDHLPLYNNLGVRFELRQHWTDEPTYRTKQRIVWEAVIDSLDSHRPAIVWDADIPEFGLIVGHEPRARRYMFSTMPRPDPWPGSMNDVPRNVGILRCFLPVERKSCDRRKAAHDSIAFALLQSQAASCYEEHLPGFAGYEAWIAAVHEGRTLKDAYSVAYTAAVVHEARSLAGPYLHEVAPLFEAPVAACVLDAAHAFEEVALALQTVRRVFPFPKGHEPAKRSVLPEGESALTRAYQAEQRAIAALARGFPELAEEEVSRFHIA